ncbi:MAG: FlgO family outer membrane protein [Nitrospirota bacterium]
MKKQLIAVALVAALTMSCQTKYTVPKTNEIPECSINHFESNPYDNMTNIDLKSAHIVEQLEMYGDIPRFTNKIIVTSFVELSNLNKTSMFGRLIAEEVLSQLHIKGYRVTDVREMKSIVMSNKVGELYLSRNGTTENNVKGKKIDITPKSFNFDYTNSLIVAGTYQVEPCEVFVNVRLISPELAEVISVATIKIPLTTMVKYLLSKASELQNEPMPSIGLRQNEPAPLIKAPAPAPKKKVKKVRPKPKKPVKKVTTVKPEEPAAPESAKPEAAVKVEVTKPPTEPAKPKEPAKPEAVAKPIEPTVPEVTPKPGTPAKH